jgi:hypothetical protein
MGLMDKMKNLKNSVTGDWATVTVRFEEPVVRGGSVKATTDVTVKGSDISVEKVILEIRCEEIIDIPNATLYPNDRNSSSSLNTSQGRATGSETVVDKEVVAAGATDLAAGSTSTYTAEIPIPTSAPPSMDGRNARYEWQIRARLDMKGNDPDSGWQTLQVG